MAQVQLSESPQHRRGLPRSPRSERSHAAHWTLGRGKRSRHGTAWKLSVKMGVKTCQHLLVSKTSSEMNINLPATSVETWYRCRAWLKFRIQWWLSKICAQTYFGAGPLARLESVPELSESAMEREIERDVFLARYASKYGSFHMIFCDLLEYQWDVHDIRGIYECTVGWYLLGILNCSNMASWKSHHLVR